MAKEAKSKKIFLVLGISREKHNWDTPIKVLQAAMPNYEVIALENKGMGEFHNDAAPMSINGNIDFLKIQFDKLKGAENYFIGWSLGGMIVTKWSKRYPEDMKKMVLITTSFGILSFFGNRLKPKNLPTLLKTIFSSGMKREEGLYRLTNSSQENKKVFLLESLAIQEKRPVTGINILRQVWAAFFYFSIVQKQHPTLVLGAKNDLLVSTSCSVKIHKKWDTPYYEHPTAGHDIFNDDPEWVTKHIKEFL